MDRRARVVLWIVHAAAIAVWVATCMTYANAPFRADETEVAWQARDGVRVHGAPVVLPSESLRQATPHEAAFGAFYGLWHPPLYVYLVAAVGALGPAEGWVRLLGVLCLLLSCVLIWRAARSELGDETPREVVALPISLALLSPIVTQGSLFVDIDNTVLATLMLLFLWRFSRETESVWQWRRVVGLTALLAFVMWAKLTTVAMVWLTCAAGAVCADRPWRRLAELTVVGLGAAAVFALTFAAYCRAFDLPWQFMFELGFGGRRDLVGTVKSWEALMRSVRWTVMWVSPVLMVLLAGATIERAVAFWRVRRLRPVDLWLVLSVGMFVAYVGVGAMIGKYVMPAALMAAAFVGVRIARGWREWRLPSWPVIVGGALVLLVASMAQPSPLIRAAAANAGRTALDPRVVTVVSLLLLAGAVAVVWTRAAGRERSRDRLGLAGLSMVVSLAAATPAPTWQLLHSPSDNGPLNAGLDVGFRELVATLQREVPADRAVIAMKDVGFHVQRRHFLLEYYLAQPGDPLIALAHRPDVWGLVDSGPYPVVTPELLARMPVRRVETVGTYRIYVLGQ